MTARRQPPALHYEPASQHGMMWFEWRGGEYIAAGFLGAVYSHACINTTDPAWTGDGPWRCAHPFTQEGLETLVEEWLPTADTTEVMYPARTS